MSAFDRVECSPLANLTIPRQRRVRQQFRGVTFARNGLVGPSVCGKNAKQNYSAWGTRVRKIFFFASLIASLAGTSASAGTIVSTLGQFVSPALGEIYVGTFRYELPVGEVITSAKFETRLGRPAFASDLSEYRVDNVNVCAAGNATCANFTPVISYSFLPSQFGQLNDGIADFYAYSDGCCVTNLISSSLTINTATLPTPPTISEIEKARHADAAATANAKLATLDLFSSLSSLGGKDMAEAVVNFLASWTGSSDTSWAQGVAIVTGILAAGLFGGPLGLGVATTYALMGAYYANVASIEQRLANDPPDPNFTEVFGYSEATLPSLGIDPVAQTYLENLTDGLGASLQSRQGYLTAIERAQGSYLAGDSASLDLQLAAYKTFKQDMSAFDFQLAGVLRQAPIAFEAGGLLPEAGAILPIMLDTANQLSVQTAVPEPATWAMMLLGFGLVGGAMRSTNRRQKSTIAYG